MKSKLTLFQKLYQKYLKEFFLIEGRAPGTPKEWMNIQDDVVREINKTKGTSKKDIPPFQGWDPKIVGKKEKTGIEKLLEGPVTSTGPKGTRTWDLSKTKKGEVIDFPKKKASGGIARVGMMIGGFTKAKVLIQMLENTLKGSKDPYVRKTFPNFIKELTKNPELANDPNVWKQFTTGLPKNQRLVVHSDDSVDFFTQSEFGPHNIERTLEFQKQHNLSRDQANTILRMEPEDRVLELKRLEIERAKNIAEKNLKGMEQESQLLDFDVKDRTKQASGGRVPLMYGGDPGFAFEYGGSWADWQDKHRDQMPVEQYIKTKLPKDRLPFRESMGGGGIIKLLKKLLQKAKPKPKKDVIKPFKFPEVGIGSDFQKKVLDDMLKSKSRLKDFDPKGKPHASGGLAYMLGEPTYMKYGVGGSVGHAPWHKPTGQQAPQGQPQPGGAQSPGRGQPNPMKGPRGLPSLAPRTMDPAFMQQQMMQKAMMGQQQPRMGRADGGGTQEDFNRFLKEREEGYREGGKRELQRDWERYKRFKQYGQGAIQEAAQGGRIGFGLGGINKGRRAFMKWLAGLTGAGIAAGSGLLKFGKAAKVIPKVAETVVTIEKTAGMPVWFPALVNKVIKQGDDVTKKLGTIEREMVHTQKIKGGEEVTVYRNLDTGNVRVEYADNVSYDTVHLEYKAPDVIESGKYKGKKTNSEFSASETEPEVVNWDGDIEWSGVNEANKVEDLITDTSKLEEFATGKPLNITKRLTSERKQKYRNKLEQDQGEQMDYIEKKHGPFPDPSDYGGGKDEMVDVFEKYRGKASGGLAHMLGE